MKEALSPESSLYRVRHSLAHVCAQAVQKLYPNVSLGFGPPTNDGFFYDFDFKGLAIEEKELKNIEKQMKKIISQNQSFICSQMTKDQALEKAKSSGQNYKMEQVENLATKGVDSFSYYENGPFSDLCEGPHVEHTGLLPVDAFKLSSLAGAYWMGSEKNPMLTRIYAFAFETKEELDHYLERRKLAEARDHKKLGKELDIFMISETVGKGLPMWLPKGAIIRQAISDYNAQMEFKYGYQNVATPHITKAELFYRSQHLPAYKESMFPPLVITEEAEDGSTSVREEYYLKPMNCPMHHLIFDHKPVSYRQLPIRLAEYGTCYRFEQSGELSGLIRVRALCMNDAHIYLAEDQIEAEMASLMQMYQEFYKTFHLTKYYYRLSIRGEANKDKFKGDDAMWTRAEEILRRSLENAGIPYKVGEGEAAFYGPKIDIQFENLLGREETVSTIQIDFLSPVNFNLNFVGSDGQEHRPVIIHRAPLSTHERFISFLLEYYGGAFPTWCAPVQVAIVPVRDEVLDYANEIMQELRGLMIRAEVDDSNNGLNKKIRNNTIAKIPNILVIGDNEKEQRSVTWRRYGVSEQQSLSFEDFKTILQNDIQTRAFHPPESSVHDTF